MSASALSIRASKPRSLSVRTNIKRNWGREERGIGCGTLQASKNANAIGGQCRRRSRAFLEEVIEKSC